MEQTETSQAPQTLPQVTTVTKNPGRVEAGKKLAEWNRQQKHNKAVKQKILSGEQQQAVEASVDTQKKDPPKTDSYLIYGIAVIGIGYTAYTLWKNKSPTKEKPLTKQEPPAKQEAPAKQEPTPQVQIDNDPFQMY